MRDTLSPTYEVVSVATCDSVLPRLERGGVDLVLLDLLMPGTSPIDSGYEVMQAVRTKYPDMPVCMFTGATTGSEISCDELSEKWGVSIVFKDHPDAVDRLSDIVSDLVD